MLLLFLTLLILTECVVPVFGVSLDNCGGSYNDKRAEVVRGETSSFTCTLGSAESTHTLEWFVNTGSDQTVGKCPPPSTGDSCRNKSSQIFTPRRTETTQSVMIVDPTQADLVTEVESGRLICRDLNEERQDSCLMDYITRASGTCSRFRVDTDTTPWTVTGDCNITRGNSSRGRYMCQWFSQTEDNLTDVAVSSLNYMRSNTLPRGSARCSTIQSLPGQDSRYTYRVMFLPGRQFFPAGTIHISRPSTPTITCTPAGLVTENSMLTCTCTTDNIGQPEGRLRWLRGSSDVIVIGAPGVDRLELRQTLSRSDDGDQFRCRLDWSDEPVTSTVYTVSVDYPPSTSALTINPSTTSGSVSVSENSTVSFNCCASCGTAEAQAQFERGDVTSYFSVAVGLGVVLALLVTVNVVVVVWLWRRRRNAPWAEQSHQSHGTMTSSPKDNAPNGSAPGFSSEGEYSGLEMSDVGLRSIYSEPTGISDNF